MTLGTILDTLRQPHARTAMEVPMDTLARYGGDDDHEQEPEKEGPPNIPAILGLALAAWGVVIAAAWGIAWVVS